MAKQINTRIQLKYDTLEAWSSKNTTLLAGEIAIVSLPPKGSGDAPDAIASGVLFKVGPGNFNSLPWASALAADVYSWAKKSGIDIVDEESGNVVAGITWENDKLVVHRLSAATSEELKNYYTKDDLDGIIEALPHIITTVEAGEGILVDNSKSTEDNYAYEVSHAVPAGAKAINSGYVHTDKFGHVTNADFSSLPNDYLKVDGSNADGASFAISATSIGLAASAGGANVSIREDMVEITASNAVFNGKRIATSEDIDSAIAADKDTQTKVETNDSYIIVDGPTSLAEDALNTYKISLDTDKVKALVAADVTAAMSFEGAVSTPPTGLGVGDKGNFYKASAEFSIATKDKDVEAVKIGDSIVWDGDGWYRIPSGDDVEDTWRPVSVNGASLGGTSEGLNLNLAQGNNVTLTHNGAGTVTITATDTWRPVFVEGVDLADNELTFVAGDNIAFEQSEDVAGSFTINAVDTTYTVAPTSNVLEFTVTPNKGSAQTVKLKAPAITSGATNGTIEVDGAEVAVTGLTQAAYANAGDGITIANGAIAVNSSLDHVNSIGGNDEMTIAGDHAIYLNAANFVQIGAPELQVTKIFDSTSVEISSDLINLNAMEVMVNGQNVATVDQIPTTTDDIEGGKETWFFNCGTASTVLDTPS